MKQDFAIVDFETRSKTNLKSYGAYRYVEDKQTIALCLGWKLPGEPARVWKRGDSFPRPLMEFISDGGKLCAWNANFDRLVWNYVYRRQVEIPFIPIRRWICAMVASAAYAGPRGLGAAAAELKVQHQKEQAGKRLIKLCCEPSKEGLFVNAPWTLGALYEYCRMDVETTADVLEHVPALAQAEEELYHVDQWINDRGIQIDMPLVRAARDRVSLLQERMASEFRQITSFNPTQRAEFQKWLRFRGIHVDNTQEATLLGIASDVSSASKEIKKAALIVLAAGKSSTAKFEKACEVPNTDGRARGAFVFYGAHTGRWAGRGVQFQNLPRGVPAEQYEDYRSKVVAGESIAPRTMGKLSSMLRGIIIAPKGHHLFNADFGQIEARILMLMAHDEYGVKCFMEGRDIYKEMAASIFGVDVSQIGDESMERFVGKTAVLGLGFGMGVFRFLEENKEDFTEEAALKVVASCSHGEGGKPCNDYYKSKNKEQYDPRIHTEAKIHATSHIVRTYREMFVGVPKYWNTLMQSVPTAMDAPNGNFGRFHYNTLTQKLSYHLHSNRKLYWDGCRYHKREIVVNKREKKGTFVKRLWGGLLTENIIQATARDVQAIVMTALEHVSPFDPVATIHDEVIAEGNSDLTVEEFQRIIHTSLPPPYDKLLSVKCSKARRYLK